MTTAASLNIRTDLYNWAQQYAKEHNTSIDKMTENYFLALMTFIDMEKRSGTTQEVTTAPDLKKGDADGKWWQNYPISEEVKGMSMGKALNIPDDDKAALQKILLEEYESLS